MSCTGVSHKGLGCMALACGLLCEAAAETPSHPTDPSPASEERTRATSH